MQDRPSGNNNSTKYISTRTLLFHICILSLICANLLGWPLQAISIEQGIDSSNKNDYLGASESNQVMTYTNNKSNVTSEHVLKAKYFIFPSQEAMFNQNVIIAKKSDAAMLSGEWPVEQSRIIASGLESLVKEEDKPKMASVNEWNITGNNGNEILVRLYDTGVSQRPSPVLIFVHGGGWTVGNVDIFDDSIRRLANSSGMVVAAMNYRLAPEHPFPAGLNDVVSTVKWIAENGDNLGINASKIALGGDSAGANLAFAAALVLKDSTKPIEEEREEGGGSEESNLIDALYLLYGPYSPELLSRESMKLFGQGDFGLTYAQMKWAMNQTFQNQSDYSNPLAFPLLADNLTGLPPVYIAAMALDPLKDDSLALANKLEEHGNEYYLSIWPGVAHGALSLIPVTQIQEYLEAMTTYLKGVLLNG
ncbi:MAG TPA: alpha/beta hydrolase [Nitrososphaeraceae archaeon]|nr:alpha/beta hydrolase [Nitrososphaeraceae archaeon]